VRAPNFDAPENEGTRRHDANLKSACAGLLFLAADDTLVITSRQLWASANHATELPRDGQVVLVRVKYDPKADACDFSCFASRALGG
jgi:hypothetical protein